MLKIVEKSFIISDDEFLKLTCCFLFSLIYSTQMNEFNESTNKILAIFKASTNFEQNFNELNNFLRVFVDSLKIR